MAEKITKELRIELGKHSGPYRVSIRPFSETLGDFVRVNRYEGMSEERSRKIAEVLDGLFSPICQRLDSYGLVLGRNYVPDLVIRNISALLSRDHIEDLALQEYVGKLDVNLQKGLPF